MAITLSNYIIPLQAFSQELQISLANVVYTLTVKWNDSDDSGWILDIADSNNVPIATCLPLITGANILAGLDYLEFGGALYVMTDGASPFDVPTFDNLGSDSNLYFQTSVTDG